MVFTLNLLEIRRPHKKYDVVYEHKKMFVQDLRVSGIKKEIVD